MLKNIIRAYICILIANSIQASSDQTASNAQTEPKIPQKLLFAAERKLSISDKLPDLVKPSRVNAEKNLLIRIHDSDNRQAVVEKLDTGNQVSSIACDYRLLSASFNKDARMSLLTQESWAPVVHPFFAFTVADTQTGKKLWQSSPTLEPFTVRFSDRDEIVVIPPQKTDAGFQVVQSLNATIYGDSQTKAFQGLTDPDRELIGAINAHQINGNEPVSLFDIRMKMKNIYLNASEKRAAFEHLPVHVKAMVTKTYNIKDADKPNTREQIDHVAHTAKQASWKFVDSFMQFSASFGQSEKKDGK